MEMCKEKSPFCGWDVNGDYQCYCDSPPTDKISKIRDILKDVDFGEGAASSWKHASWFCALTDIKKIVEE